MGQALGFGVRFRFGFLAFPFRLCNGFGLFFGAALGFEARLLFGRLPLLGFQFGLPFGFRLLFGDRGFILRYGFFAGPCGGLGGLRLFFGALLGLQPGLFFRGFIVGSLGRSGLFRSRRGGLHGRRQHDFKSSLSSSGVQDLRLDERRRFARLLCRRGCFRMRRKSIHPLFATGFFRTDKAGIDDDMEFSIRLIDDSRKEIVPARIEVLERPGQMGGNPNQAGAGQFHGAMPNAVSEFFRRSRRRSLDFVRKRDRARPPIAGIRLELGRIDFGIGRHVRPRRRLMGCRSHPSQHDRQAHVFRFHRHASSLEKPLPASGPRPSAMILHGLAGLAKGFRGVGHQ
ncbi:MAG TPA: hypothetical protein P5204_00650 [Kiritimatiellia bacterium]|nr:hypothetical protein [Kiritimatiellia bacterium]